MRAHRGCWAYINDRPKKGCYRSSTIRPVGSPAARRGVRIRLMAASEIPRWSTPRGLLIVAVDAYFGVLLRGVAASLP